MSSAWTHGTCYMANVNTSEQCTTTTRAFILNSIIIMLMCNMFYMTTDTQLSRLLLLFIINF